MPGPSDLRAVSPFQEELARFTQPPRPRRRVELACWASSAVVFTTGMFISALSYPEPFDCRFELISTLLSNRDNPRGYVFANGALIIAALLLVPVLIEVSRSFRSRHPRMTRASSISGVVGLSFGAIVGLEKLFFSQWTRRVHKLHEVLAGIALVSLLTAGLCYGFLAFKSRAPRWKKALTLALVLTAPLGMICSKCFVDHYWPGLGWVGAGWKRLGVPTILSFAFWQWLFVISAYLSILVLLEAARRIGNEEAWAPASVT